jgi:hypothetical protein
LSNPDLVQLRKSANHLRSLATLLGIVLAIGSFIMKPLKFSKKLSINRETLRTLTNDELARANGGYVVCKTDWCSTESLSKCEGTAKCIYRQ